MKKNFIFETLLIIFLGSLTSLSLPPYNFFFLNFFTFSVFFIFLFQRLKQGIKKSLLVADMPKGSYRDISSAEKNARVNNEKN